MTDPVLHLRHPRRKCRSLCGLPRVAERPLATSATLSPTLALELADAEGSRPTCRTCVLELLASALPRYGVRFIDEYTTALAPERAPLWTGTPLRERREAVGLTRAAVARSAGLSESTLRSIESRRHRVTPRVLRRLLSVPRLGPDDVE